MYVVFYIDVKNIHYDVLGMLLLAASIGGWDCSWGCDAAVVFQCFSGHLLFGI